MITPGKEIRLMNINATNYVAEFIVLCQPLSPSSFSMFILWRIIPIL